MIYYRHARPETRHPYWLDGWQGYGEIACNHAIGATGETIVSIGPMLLYAPTGSPEWRPCADGWECCEAGRWVMVPRRLTWCEMDTATDTQGRSWAVPRMLMPDGTRGYRCAYGGQDWTAMPTPAQSRAEGVAREARSALMRAVEYGDDLEAGPACTWAATLLAVANHVPVEAIQALGLLDDQLIGQVLSLASGGRRP